MLNATSTAAVIVATTTAPVPHIATPKQVKAIYMSACAASAPSFRQSLENLIDSTELNAVVLDIKDFSGTILVPRCDRITSPH